MLVKRSFHFPDGMDGTAVFSEDGKYRYLLTRRFNTQPLLVMVQLNPSDGDEKKLEATNAGNLSRAKKWGYGGIAIYNLFGLISSNPKDLYTAKDPIGEHGNASLTSSNEQTSVAVCAWGRHGKFMDRQDWFFENVTVAKLMVLGWNKDGTPKHPLHMSHSIKPMDI
jgi:hypothetical protein